MNKSFNEKDFINDSIKNFNNIFNKLSNTNSDEEFIGVLKQLRRRFYEYVDENNTRWVYFDGKLLYGEPYIPLIVTNPSKEEREEYIKNHKNDEED